MPTFYGLPSDGTVIPEQLETALAADIAAPESPIGWAVARSPLEKFFAALDMREQRSLVIAHASDSTGDADTEYFELAWKAAFAAVWAERPVRVRRWTVTGDGGYVGWSTWQSGGSADGSTAEGLVFADDFSTDSATVINTLSPDVGLAYTEHTAHGAYWSVSGGKLNRSGANDGVRATLRARWEPKQSKDWTFTGKVNVPAGPSNVEAEVMVASVNETTGRVAIKVNGAGDATLGQYFDATTTALGTFPAGTYTGVEVDFTLSLSGSTLTATLAGNTLTATLTQPQVDLLATDTTTIVRSQLPGTLFDDFQATSTVPVEALPSIPGVDVYNGGAAGKTAEYHRGRLAEFFPVRPDVLFINHGHNYQAAGDVQGFLDSVQGLVDDLAALYPSERIPVVVTSQNPQFGSGREADHLARMLALREYAVARGWGYLPTFEAFAARPDGGADQLQDALHPGIGTGRVLQANVAEAWIRAQSRRPLA